MNQISFVFKSGLQFNSFIITNIENIYEVKH